MQVIQSARANAVNNHGMDDSRLVVGMAARLSALLLVDFQRVIVLHATTACDLYLLLPHIAVHLSMGLRHGKPTIRAEVSLHTLEASLAFEHVQSNCLTFPRSTHPSMRGAYPCKCTSLQTRRLWVMVATSSGLGFTAVARRQCASATTRT